MSEPAGVGGQRTVPPEPAAGEFSVAGRQVDPQLNRIAYGDRTHQIEPKIMQVLMCLAGAGGRVVTKDELRDRVWPGVHVTDDVLVRAVSELRKLLGEEDGAPVIETIRKRGYRLLAPVVRETPSAPTPDAPTPPRQRGAGVVLLVAVAVIAGLAALARPPSPPRESPASRAPRFTPVTALAGSEFDPAVSPDGTRVAFAWAPPDAPTHEATDLYLRTQDGTTQIPLTAGRKGAWAPVWSPDGTRIAFLRYENGCEIAVVSALGGAVERLAPCTDTFLARFAWSPDGAALLGTRRDAGLVRMPLGGGEPISLTRDPGAFQDTDPAYAPDGTTVAFVRRLGDGIGDIYRVPASGGTATRLTHDDAEVIGLAWIDAGRRIAFSSNRAGVFSLWAVAAAGGEPELLAGGGRKIKHPSAARTGDAVAYEAWDCEMNLCARSVDGGADLELAPAADQWTLSPRHAPDGEWIAFTSTRSGSYELWMSRADGTGARTLTSFGGPYVGHPRWSPDGRRIAFVARSRGRGEAWVVDVAGGPPQRLTASPADEAAPSWSSDGARVYYASLRSGRWQVVERRLATGEERVVIGEGGHAALESPDGRWLYFTRRDRAGLWRRARGEDGRLGPEEVVSRTVSAGEAGAWGIGAAGTWWLEEQGVVLLRPGASAPTPLVSLTGLAWRSVDLSPDGRRVVYPRFGRNDSNILSVSWSPP